MKHEAELDKEGREERLLDTLNEMIRNSEPIYVKDFNKVARCKTELIELEKKNDKIGLRLYDYEDQKSGYAISTFSLIATITDILVDKRLAFSIDDGDGRITGVQWYKHL